MVSTASLVVLTTCLLLLAVGIKVLSSSSLLHLAQDEPLTVLYAAIMFCVYININ